MASITERMLLPPSKHLDCLVEVPPPPPPPPTHTHTHTQTPMKLNLRIFLAFLEHLIKGFDGI